MTEVHALTRDAFAGLAEFLQAQPPDVWDQGSLCTGWQVRHVIAHVTMAGRMTTAEFGAEMAAAHGDFQQASDGIAIRDGDLPIADLLTSLRSPRLAEWEPPGGGAIGALNHAVVHGLDITNALDQPRTCSDEAAQAVLENLVTGGTAARFDVDVSDIRIVATDLHWSAGSGREVNATAAQLISLVCHRVLPGGPTLGQPA